MMTFQARLIAWAGAIGVLAMLLTGAAFYFQDHGRQIERAVWLKKEAAERIADAALIAKHAAEMQALTDHQRTIERQTSENHQQELLDLHHERDRDRAAADRAGGLRIPAPACAPGSVVPGAETAGAARTDEASAGTVRLPQPVENHLWTDADDADEVSAQLRALQAWVRANGFYGPQTADNSRLLDRMIAAKNTDTEAPE